MSKLKINEISSCALNEDGIKFEYEQSEKLQKYNEKHHETKYLRITYTPWIEVYDEHDYAVEESIQ